MTMRIATQGALQLVAQSEQHTRLPVTATIADAAYGDGHTRQQFADAGRTLIAKVRKPPPALISPKRISRSTWRRVPAPVRRVR